MPSYVASGPNVICHGNEHIHCHTPEQAEEVAYLLNLEHVALCGRYCDNVSESARAAVIRLRSATVASLAAHRTRPVVSYQGLYDKALAECRAASEYTRHVPIVIDDDRTHERMADRRRLYSIARAAHDAARRDAGLPASPEGQ